jgi:hypothetical protein
MLEAMERLRRVAADGPRDCEALCDTLLDAFGSQQRDDIVVFAARLTGR